MCGSKSYKPAHGGYPGAVAPRSNPTQAHPVGTRIRILTRHSHYFIPGETATVVEEGPGNEGASYRQLNVLAQRDKDGLKQRLFVEDYEVIE